MEKLTNTEIGSFLNLFIRNGYVLNFSTNDFDVFTLNSNGIALCDKYKASKGKSLTAYINEASYEDKFKLIFYLFDYYEEKMGYEFNQNYEYSNAIVRCFR